MVFLIILWVSVYRKKIIKMFFTLRKIQFLLWHFCENPLLETLFLRVIAF